MRKTSWLAWGIVLGISIVTIGVGCSSDDDSKATAGSSRKGERCQSTADCVAGLACLPNGSSGGGGGTCVVGVFQVAPLAKECARVQCQTVADCCQNQGSGCDTLKKECDQETDAGFAGAGSICQTYNAECGCDAQSRGCENGLCVSKCVDDSGCKNQGNLKKCLGGKCGQCGTDDDCKSFGDKLTCVNAVCQPPCQSDGDCFGTNGFDRCVNGKCIPGGCQNNRECIVATSNVESTCGTDGKCIVPCQTDLECGSPTSYRLFSCIEHKCQFAGCDDDKECELLFVNAAGGFSSSSSSSGGASSGPQTHYVCRDKLK